MGAWGHGPFENDSAGDWMCDLEDADDWTAFIASTFHEVQRDAEDDMEVDAGCYTIAAGEVLATLKGKPAEKPDQQLTQWTEGKSAPDTYLYELALKTVPLVLAENSEANELWEETDDYEDWKATVNSLLSRLKD